MNSTTAPSHSALERYGLILCVAGTLAALMTESAGYRDVVTGALGEAARLVGMGTLTIALMRAERHDGRETSRRMLAVGVLFVTAVAALSTPTLTTSHDPGGAGIRALLGSVLVLTALAALIAWAQRRAPYLPRPVTSAMGAPRRQRNWLP